MTTQLWQYYKQQRGNIWLLLYNLSIYQSDFNWYRGTMYLSCDECVQAIPVLSDADGNESHLKELFLRDVKRLA